MFMKSAGVKVDSKKIVVCSLGCCPGEPSADALALFLRFPLCIISFCRITYHEGNLRN